MYDMYPVSYGEPAIEHDENPFSERDMNGLGQSEYYQVTVPAREQHPPYPAAYAHLAEQPLRRTAVEVIELDV
jgi:hypothetical protein